MENKEKNIFIHVGLHKTATTFLQTKIFPFIKEVQVAGYCVETNSNCPLNNLVESYNNIKYKNDSKLIDNELKLLKKEFLNFINQNKEKNILISNEALAASYRNYNKSSHLYLANCLKNSFNNAKIIYIIRKQSDWLESFYNQYIIKNNAYSSIDFGGYSGFTTLNQFIGYENNSFKNKGFLNINDLDWYYMTKNYIELFGKENVLVLPYELLKENLNEFLRRFYEFTDFKPYYPESIEIVNEKMSKEIFKYNPVLSKYGKFIHSMEESTLKKFILKNDRGIKKFLNKYFTKNFNFNNENLSKEQKEIITNIHKDSNKKLSELIEIDLRQYRYF